MTNILKFLFFGLAIFLSSCKDDPIDEPIIEKEFGKVGTYEVSTFTAEDYVFSTVYYPSDISTFKEKSPVIFFVSGWIGGGVPSTKYETLMKFVASQGITIVYVDEGATTDFKFSIDAINTILDKDFVKTDILPFVDKTKFGIIGHSAGGGLVFTLLDRFKEEYGENGRFVMALDPWFAFGMDDAAMKGLPSNTNVSIIKFGTGGNSDNDGTDARIPLTEFYLLNSIEAKNKDYQVFENADHHYPYGEEIPGIVEPLHALMEYTFVDQAEYIRKIALEKGNDDPYADGNGIQVVLDSYKYPCDAGNTLIDYCEIVP